MPRNLYQPIPDVINSVELSKNNKLNILEVATGNKGKLQEIERILKNFTVIGKDLSIEEIQSVNPYKVVEAKAKSAWEKNNYNPILVEDVSLELKGLGGRPGTYVNDFCSEIEMRNMICKVWLKDRDRSAVGRIIYAIYDGTEVHTWEEVMEGTIPE